MAEPGAAEAYEAARLAFERGRPGTRVPRAAELEPNPTCQSVGSLVRHRANARRARFVRSRHSRDSRSGSVTAAVHGGYAPGT
jgi:hypothetical protein